MRIPAARRELPSLSKERDRLVLGITQTSEMIHDLGTHGGSLREVLGRLWERVQQLPDALPVAQRFRRIVESYPLSCPAMPLRRFPGFARILPVVGDQRRPLAELRGVDLLDRAGDRCMDAGSSLR